ncbi:transcriptional regulator, MarR family [Sulfolobus islandicus Y.G.57.14]|nr:regulatory protein MarR [Sulfolobus islandicus L.S.2.15]ACP37918.1 transcriptional regulator, MarR family [Sulfolobus islandicus M.14.25]ACP45419.1 transcriptional regulator, MarR family [Sulfolobus islandicus Y.G.57.14]ACP48781.1 transcriptional regulator, MarR family [Sulfolobus islandicus Y.N.15.51]ACP55108.1 transcriptional regulator, MarR family [Sulfolobus islandicus M.16.27]ACR41750.1 transcriptional regulator, MarR family [Sulfolobus islandicus M.16.4]ADB86944.1 regulatory protein,
MNVKELAILTLLSEGELSVKEIQEYVSISRRNLVKTIRKLERKGYIQEKAYVGDDVIVEITEYGMEMLYKNFVYLRDLINEMENVLCTKFDC